MKSDSIALSFILALCRTEGATLYDLQRLSGTGRRNVYYRLACLRASGVEVYREGRRFYADADSVFFKRMNGDLLLNTEEAAWVYRQVSRGVRTGLKTALRRKLERTYDFGEHGESALLLRMNRNIEQLRMAIRAKRPALLLDYVSPHSGTVRHRVVEPYALHSDDQDVECYEPASHRNKTFKVARIRGVVCSEHLRWSYEDRHELRHTDVFGFTGGSMQRVVLHLGLLSARLLKEEHPRAAAELVRVAADKWELDIPVTSYRGIGRFVLPLLGDVTVVRGEEFRQYLISEADKALEWASKSDLNADE